MNLRVVLIGAVHREPIIGDAGDAARIDGHGGRRTALHVYRGNQQSQRVVAARRGQRLEDLLIDDVAVADTADVDHRRRIGDGNRLGELADGQFGIQIGSKGATQLNPLAHEGGKPGQLERHRIRASLDRDDQVLTVAVGNGNTNLLDERGAASLDGDAGQHASRRIANRAANGLRRGR